MRCIPFLGVIGNVLFWVDVSPATSLAQQPSCGSGETATETPEPLYLGFLCN
jgi:hypothetical protein